MVSMETKEETKNTLAVKLVAYHEDGQLIDWKKYPGKLLQGNFQLHALFAMRTMRSDPLNLSLSLSE